MPTAAILAGGRAARFGGRDKSALVIGGQSILERQLAELSRLTDDILVVGADKGSVPGSLCRVVPDRTPGCGPLGGLDAALAAAKNEVVVIVACDMPFVTSAFLGHLVDLIGNADAVVPRTERGYHPLCAVYTQACRGPVVRRLAERRLKMLDLLADLRVRALTTAEIEAFGGARRLLANVNTPADYEAIETAQSHEA
jgi:molybdopterin-guanine dinucleotide biosynthesis protein A